MARIHVSDELELKLSRMYTHTDDICKKAIYEGAKVMADAMKAEIDALPVDDSKHEWDKMRSGIRTIQKIGLQKSFGVAPFRESNGVWDTHLGFEGYNEMVSNYYTGQANSMIARSVNAGTSFLRANPFIDRTSRNFGMKARERMEEVIKEELAKET